MDDQASSFENKTKETFQFFDAPPIWFALIVWMYPLLLIVLFVLSACTSTTQGALTSAVSKAFSSVNSQLEKLPEIEARERESNAHSAALEPNLQSLERARTLSKLASSCYSQGKYDESESLFLKSLAIREKLAGPNDPEVAESLIGLGLVYATRRQFDKAIVVHKRALAIDEEQLGHDHPIVASDLRNLASDYKGAVNSAEYEKLIKRAIAIDGNVPKSKQVVAP